MSNKVMKAANLREWKGSLLVTAVLLASLLIPSAEIALAQSADSADAALSDAAAETGAIPATDTTTEPTEDAALELPAGPTVADKQAEADRIKTEIASIDATAEQAIERYNVASTELELTNQQMVENEQALAQTAARLQGARSRLGKRLENIYKDGSLGFINVILDTNSFNDFLTRFDMLGKISNQDRSDIDDVIRYQKDIEQVQEELESSRALQAELAQTLAAEQAAIEGQLAAKETVLSGVEGEVTQMVAEQLQAEQKAEWSATATPPLEAGTDEEIPPASEADNTQSTDTSGDITDTTADTSDGTSSDPPPPSTIGDVASIAEQYLGVPYVWGGASPSGFDCSGLVLYVFAQVGIPLPHSAAAQYYSGTPVTFDQLQRGDLVFFGSPISHVGIYLGGGMMIHAPMEGQSVTTATVGGGGSYAGACRI